MSAQTIWIGLRDVVRAGESMHHAVALAKQLKTLTDSGQWPLPPDTFMPETANELSGELFRIRRREWWHHVEQVTDYFINLYK